MRILTLFIWMLIVLGSAESHARTIVVWIGLDGLRHDYLKLFNPPTLNRLAREGAFTNRVIPIFPSLTFPNHASAATGTTVDRHGIPANTFFDQETRQLYNFPDDAKTLRAEPIWVTAKRQGVRVGVFDWPMSHAQTGANSSDYSWERYESQTDARRLERVAQIMQDDRNAPPLGLVITYMAQVDQIAHRNGPTSDRTREALLASDTEIDTFLKSTLAWFDRAYTRNDELIFLITTDHGMMAVHTLVNIELLLGAELWEGTRAVTSGPVACINLPDVPAGQRAARIDRILERLKGYSFVTAWRGNEIPESLRFNAQGRMGDVTLVLAPGYNITTTRLAATQPVAPTASPGAHGYDPSTTPDMIGSAIVWRYRKPLQGRDLGPVTNTQWHATVARWLGIEPATGSDNRAIQLP